MIKNDNGEVEIDFLRLFQALWRNVLVMILVALIFGAAAFGISYLFITPQYQASATMYVNNSTVSVGGSSFSISSGELTAAQTLVSTYIEILKSRTTLEEVIEEAGLPYTPGGLKGMIAAANVQSTGIFRVTVTSKSPTEAELIANTIAKVLPDRIADIVDGSSVRIVDYAIVPAHRSSPDYLINTGIGALIGFAFVAGIICLKELLSLKEDVLIHSTDDVTKLYPDIPVLAIIPDMRTSSKKSYYSAYTSYYNTDLKEAK